MLLLSIVQAAVKVLSKKMDSLLHLADYKKCFPTSFSLPLLVTLTFQDLYIQEIQEITAIMAQRTVMQLHRVIISKTFFYAPMPSFTFQTNSTTRQRRCDEQSRIYCQALENNASTE